MINEQSRVWIYQSNREFNINELSQLADILNNFTQSWSAHNQQLKATYEIKYHRFIILIVDESQAGASGCSIDKSVHLVQKIEQQFNVNLFDRLNIAYKKSEFIETANRMDFEQLINDGLISENTIVFNNLVSTYKDYLNNWETPLKNSWHASFFNLANAI